MRPNLHHTNPCLLTTGEIFKAEYDVRRTDHGRRDRLLFLEIQKPALVPGRLSLVFLSIFTVIFRQLEPLEAPKSLLSFHLTGTTASSLAI